MNPFTLPSIKRLRRTPRIRAAIRMVPTLLMLSMAPSVWANTPPGGLQANPDSTQRTFGTISNQAPPVKLTGADEVLAESRGSRLQSKEAPKAESASGAAVLAAFAANAELPASTSSRLWTSSISRLQELRHSGFTASSRGLDAARELGQHAGRGTGELISSAIGLIGIPYRFGGESKEEGFDCSGLIQHLYANTIGLVLPRTAAEQARTKDFAKVDKNDLIPGDLVFFNTRKKAFSHVGLYMGDGRFLHAPRTGAKVRIETMKTPYWDTRYNGARRMKPA